mmetsp:Transcript_32257/g.67367  ORF Transcript_32257/g.67367 Transcript_32257/m.67367 type:complete len:113 (+) Transcript_32257:1023-1361(+)
MKTTSQRRGQHQKLESNIRVLGSQWGQHQKQKRTAKKTKDSSIKSKKTASKQEDTFRQGRTASERGWQQNHEDSIRKEVNSTRIRRTASEVPLISGFKGRTTSERADPAEHQ